jgi:HK97 family phage major capsid protein
MVLSNEELLRKAALTTDDFGGDGEAPLSIEQVAQFLQVMIKPQVMLPDVRTVTSNAAKWQESKIQFGDRIMHVGTEGERLDTTKRTKPATGKVEISTVLLRGEVPVADEVMEDNVARAGFGDVITSMVGEATGRDVEDLFINGGDEDLTGGDGYYDSQDGWLALAQGTGANVVVATDFGQDYQQILKALLTAMPDQFKRDLEANGRYYAPKRLVEKYRDILAARGTAYGDLQLTGSSDIKYQGITLTGVPIMHIDASDSPITAFILLTHRQNLYAGFHRQIKMETFRDPREGATSFIVTTRVNSQIAHIPATAIATEVDVTP